METDWKLFLHAHVLPGTSAGEGWSLSGWRPVAAGCWATGRAARRLWGPEPDHKPDTTRTKLDGGAEDGGLEVCRCATQWNEKPSHLCTFPCYPMVIRKDSTVDQPRRTLAPQLHLCFLNSIQKDRRVSQVSLHEYFGTRNWVDYKQRKVWITAIIAWNSHILWPLMTKGI